MQSPAVISSAQQFPPQHFLIANTVTEVMHLSAQILVEDDGSMYLRVSKGDAVQCRNLFAGFKLHMQGLEEQYPENIQVNYLEV